MINQREAPTVGESAAELYESVLVPGVYNIWARFVVEMARPRTGDRALDIACGTGAVTRLLAGRIGIAGHVTGLDSDPAMLNVARRSSQSITGAPIEWKEGSAVQLPFRHEIFDIVTCQQGLPYFSNRANAVQEMYRVLRTQGRLAVMVWRGIEHSPGFNIFAAILDHYLGADASNELRLAFSMNNEAELHALLMRARFRNIMIESATASALFNSVEDFVRSMVIGTSLARPLAALPREAGTEMLTVIVNALKSYISDFGLTFPVGAFLVSAKK